MKIKSILAATAMVAAINSQAQGIQYFIAQNPEIDLSELTVDKDGYYELFNGKDL